MSIYDFQGYLAHPRPLPAGAGGLGAELIGFNARTGRPVQAAAGLRAVSGPDGIGALGALGSLGSYSDLSTDFYKTFQHDNWQHPGSEGWSSANMPGWGENPNLQMFARRGVGAEAAESGKGTALISMIAVGAVLSFFVFKLTKERA